MRTSKAMVAETNQFCEHLQKMGRGKPVSYANIPSDGRGNGSANIYGRWVVENMIIYGDGSCRNCQPGPRGVMADRFRSEPSPCGG
jgi:hypothetical protein